MLRIVLAPNGYLVSDFEAEKYADEVIQDYHECDRKTIIYVGTEHMFDVFVLRAMQGAIASDKVEFFKEDKKIKFDLIHGAYEFEDGTAFESLYTKTIDEIVSLGFSHAMRGGTIHD